MAKTITQRLIAEMEFYCDGWETIYHNPPTYKYGDPRPCDSVIKKGQRYRVDEYSYSNERRYFLICPKCEAVFDHFGLWG